MSAKKEFSFEELMNLIHTIENNVPVDKWLARNHRIWPLVRIELAFDILREIRAPHPSNPIDKEQPPIIQKNDNFFSFLFRNIKDFFSLFRLYFKLKNIDIIFGGASNYRESVNGKFINKFYEPIYEDIKKEKDQSITIEISKKENYQNKRIPSTENHIFLEDYRSFFSKIRVYFYNLFLRKAISIPGEEDFIKILYDHPLLKEKIKNRFNNISNFILKHQFFSDYLFFKFCLAVSRPKATFQLCYYNSSMLGFIEASNGLNIPSIEIQHGPQGPLHPAYGLWKKEPEDYYYMHPKYYWIWDKETKQNLIKGLCRNKQNKVFVLGNPWHQFWHRKDAPSHNFEFPNNIILVSLQPLGKYMDDFLVETIKETYNDYDWWIRIHPRQINKITYIKDFFRRKNILEKVNIEDATNYPLPLILEHTKIHITKTSGVVQEASSFGVISITTHELSKNYYEQLIKDKKVIPLEPPKKESLTKLIKENMNTKKKSTLSKKINYSEEINKTLNSSQPEKPQ